MNIKVGQQMPFFEFLDGIKGKSLYDLKQRYHFIIYQQKDDKLEEREEEFEKANVKLIDYVQVTTKGFLDQFGLKEDEDFIIIVDQYGTILYIDKKVPSFEEIMGIISFSENEGCCAL